MARTQSTSTQIFEDQIISENIDALIYDIAVRAGVFVPVNERSYRYKNYMVLQGPDGLWHVFSLNPRKRFLQSTFLKITAFAACKLHEKRDNRRLAEISSADTELQKHYTDSRFYRNTYKRTKDPVLRDTAHWRYEIAYAKVKKTKAIIDHIFYQVTA